MTSANCSRPSTHRLQPVALGALDLSAERVVPPEQGTSGVIVEAGLTATVFDSPSDSPTPDYIHGRFR